MVFKKGNIPWNKGISHSEKTLKKLEPTLFKKGHIPWIKGKHLNEETKKKIKLAHIGKPLNHKSDCMCGVCKAKKGINSGKSNPMWGKKGINNPLFGTHHTEEWKQKMKGKIPWNKGKNGIFSEESMEKLRKASLGRIPPIKGKTIDEFFGNEKAEKIRKKISFTHINKPKSERTKEKISVAHKNHFKDDNYVKNFFRRFTIKPNGLELYLDCLLQNYFPDEWDYVGDGQVIINGLCPDFINCNGKKQIIEIFGDYWHNRKNMKYYQTEEGRKEAFAKFGFSTLIIWESELINEQMIIEKIRGFK